MRQLLRGLQAFGNEGVQTRALTELCDMLSMGSDDAMTDQQVGGVDVACDRVSLLCVGVVYAYMFYMGGGRGGCDC